MAPKFRGGSDDWLDDEDSNQREGSAPKKKSPKAAFLPPEEGNATVIEVYPKQARVVVDGAEGTLLCGYRRAQVIQSSENVRERSPVAVGDRVLIAQLNPQDGIVEGVCSRRNSLARPAPGKEQKKDESIILHVVAANIDLLVIVASVRSPEFSAGLVDRYIIAAQAAGIPSLICLTKTDLLPTGLATGLATSLDDTSPKPWLEYQKIGYPVFALSVATGEGVNDLLPRLEGKTVVFCGHSGVGKTSLFRTILEKNVGKTGEVSESTGKGRHTTTSSVLYQKGDSKWIDTPGIREFGLIGVTSENLSTYFPEFKDLECSRRGCSHIGMDDCQATALFRYPSFSRIHDSLLEIEA
jgi:ribosome biogenesis GTPase